MLTINGYKYPEKLRTELTDMEKNQDENNIDKLSQTLTTILKKAVKEVAERKKHANSKMKSKKLSTKIDNY